MSTALSTLADEILTSAVDALIAPPARQFVAHGLFAHDCDLVAVNLSGLSLEPAGIGGGCAFVPTASYVITVLRCYPTADATGKPPAPAALTAASDQLLDDADALYKAVAASFLAGVYADCERLVGAPGLEAVGPSGGIAGWRFRLSISF